MLIRTSRSDSSPDEELIPIRAPSALSSTAIAANGLYAGSADSLSIDVCQFHHHVSTGDG